MSKYKLTVKYSGVCELSFESDKKETIEKEFDRYMASFLSGNVIKNVLKMNFAQSIDKLKEEKAKELSATESNAETKPEEAPKTDELPEESHKELSFKEYVKNKNIYNPLDEFVAGACYLDEILNVKEFTLKQINSRLYPVFKRLADLGIIEHAKERVLIETKEIDGQTHYSINQNAWNYHNYDLVRHQ